MVPFSLTQPTTTHSHSTNARRGSTVRPRRFSSRIFPDSTGKFNQQFNTARHRGPWRKAIERSFCDRQNQSGLQDGAFQGRKERPLIQSDMISSFTIPGPGGQ